MSLICIAKRVDHTLAYVRLKGVVFTVYLQYRHELFNNTPALIVKLILLQFERLVCCNTVDWLPILKGKHHHIMG